LLGHSAPALTPSLKDSSGNSIHSTVDANGDYHLGTSFIQEIITSTNNSTIVDLASSATFTGAADETFGTNAIQLYHAADQNCTIYIDQSIDSSFTYLTQTITDSFTCLANSPCSRTFVSVAPYYRLRVTNNGASTTTKLSTFTGMTPVLSVLPRSLTYDDRLKVETTVTGKENNERHQWITPTNSALIDSAVRLVGTTYDGTTKDTNFWTETKSADATVTQAGEIQLNTGTTANGYATYTSVRKARFVGGSALKLQGLFKYVTEGTADNVRRAGAYTATDGFFFQLDGTTFSIGTRKASSDTLVNSGNFNGNYGVNFTPITTAYYKLEIEWTPKSVFFYIDGKLLHKIGTGHLSNLLTLPIKYENINDNDSVVDVAFDCLGVVISRLGALQTNPTSKYVSGVSVTICKYGAGTLKGIVVSAIVNTADINIYDGTAITYPAIWKSGNQGARTEPFNIDFYGLPFSDGLTLEIVDADADVLIVYE